MMNKKCARKHKQAKVEERGHWASKVEFLLAVAGNIVGLGNVWRFPYLCYKNGGGAFLVPYLVFVVTCGVPLFLLETTIGQYTQQGAITIWRKLCPLAEGIGYCGQLILFYSCMTNIIILSWALLYLVFSFSSQLPWASCNNYWSTDDCIDFSAQNKTSEWTNQTNTTSAATEFWERRVLAISGGIEEIGSFRWEVLLCHCYLTTKGSYGVLRQMTWPPQSPDLNPIQMVWGELDRRVKAKGPTSAKHLWELLQDCWKTISGDYLLKLIERMPRDNDPKHTSRLCKGYLTKKESDGVLRQMTWPPQSPDLNPIQMVWGAERLYGIVKDMTGEHANPFFKICWLYLTPLVSLGSFICSLVEYQPLTFNRWYVYPTWAYVLGWVLALSSILLVPGWALYKLGTGTCSLSQRFHHLCRPDPAYSLTEKRETELQHIKEGDL
ncbi:sodium- and chloride-dependent GABA transporter 2-like [Epinephelus lanceolatus]